MHITWENAASADSAAALQRRAGVADIFQFFDTPASFCPDTRCENEAHHVLVLLGGFRPLLVTLGHLYQRPHLHIARSTNNVRVGSCRCRWKSTPTWEDTWPSCVPLILKRTSRRTAAWKALNAWNDSDGKGFKCCLFLLILRFCVSDSQLYLGDARQALCHVALCLARALLDSAGKLQATHRMSAIILLR